MKHLLLFLALLFSGVLLSTEVIFEENFNSAECLKKFKHWSPTGSGGKLEFDAQEGHKAPGCAVFSVSMRAGLAIDVRKHKPLGGIYRFSCYAKSDTPGMGTMIMRMFPGVNGYLVKAATISLPLHIKKEWTYHEAYLFVPADGSYAAGKSAGFMPQLGLQNFAGKVFVDDYKVERISDLGVWQENFTDKATAGSWGLFSRSDGIEGTADIKYVEKGCCDPGAWLITWKSGKSGYGIAPKKALDAKKFAPGKYTLLASVKADKGSEVLLSVDQFDANGKLLEVFHATGAAAGDYKLYSLPFELRKDAVSFKPGVVNSGKGSILVDNLVILPANPAEAREIERNRKPALWGIVSPFDFYSYVDNEEPNIKMLAGRTSYFKIHIAGDKSLNGDSIVDVTLPEELQLLSAQFSVYGPERKYQKLADSEPGTNTYRFVNPVDWKKYMMGNKPNHYSGLQIIVKCADKVGKLKPIKIDMRLGNVQGEKRIIPIELFKPEKPVEIIKEYRIGNWGGSAAYLRNEKARAAYLTDWLKSGVSYTTLHESQKAFSEHASSLGFSPSILVHSPDYIRIYTGKKDLPYRTLADGRVDKGHLALGAAMADPEYLNLYREYLKKCIALLPRKGHAIVQIDIEFWSTGQSTLSCFHPGTIAEFRKWAKIGNDVKLDSKIILKQYVDKWSAFRNYVTVKLHKNVKEMIHSLRKDCEFVAYDYTLNLDGTPPSFVKTVPCNTLEYDRGDAIDAHQVSYYNYEGVVFLDHADNDTRHLKKPIWGVPYPITSLQSVQQPGWSYHHPSAEELRLEVLGGAASGLRGLCFFTGNAYDAPRLNAVASGLHAVIKYKDYYFKGKRADETVKLSGMTKDMRYRGHEYKGRKLVTVFNCGKTDQTVTLPGNRKITVKSMDFAQILL